MKRSCITRIFTILVFIEQSFGSDWHRSNAGSVIIQRTLDTSKMRRPCQTPPTPNHGHIRVADDRPRYYPGEFVVYQCKDGYSLSGNEINFCVADGSWNWKETDVALSCVKDNKEPLITRRDVVEVDEPLGCIDQHEECEEWASKGFCEEERYSWFIRKNCNASCGYCKETRSSRDDRFEVDCSSYPSFWCEYYRQKIKGMCSQYYFQTKCLVTCDQCVPEETTTPHTRPLDDDISSTNPAQPLTTKTTVASPEEETTVKVTTTPRPVTTTTTTTVATTTTAKPVTPSTQECVDNHSLCKTWKTRGYCSRREYSYAMEKYCGVTCNICNSIVNGEKDCQDESASCSLWKPYCDSTQHSARIQKLCSKTCGLCRVNKDQEDTQTTSTNAKIECGMPKKHLDYSLTKYRIIGGSSAQYGSLPWNVGLYHNGGFVCGGTLINSDYVITAAHCFNDTERNRNPSSGYIATMGKHNKSLRTRNSGEIRRHFEKIIMHPGYDPRTDGNDIALIKLSEKVSYSDYIRPICLPEADEAPQRYSPVLVSGWGYTGSMESNLPLQKVTLQLVGNAQCNSWLSLHTGFQDIVSKDMICAGFSAGSRDACSGDSGGPLIMKKHSQSKQHVLLGIVSFGYGCALPQIPGVYTRVSSYIDWINQNMK